MLLSAIQDGLQLLLWQQESFAYADSYAEDKGRYLGLRSGKPISLTESNLMGLLVKPEVAWEQLENDRIVVTPPPPGGGTTLPPSHSRGPGPAVIGPLPIAPIEPAKPKRFHGSVKLDATRVGRDAGRIGDEVIAHLVGLMGSRVTVTLEIAAEIPTGVPENVVRTVTENARTLKFTDQGFEES